MTVSAFTSVTVPVPNCSIESLRHAMTTASAVSRSIVILKYLTPTSDRDWLRTGKQHVLRHVFVHRDPGADHGAGTDRDTRHDSRARAEPHPVADDNWFGLMQIPISQAYTSTGSQKHHVVADVHVIPNRDGCSQIEHGALVEPAVRADRQALVNIS